MKEVDIACLAIVDGFKRHIEETGDMNPTVVALFPERKSFNTTTVKEVLASLVMEAITIAVVTAKKDGAGEVVVGQTAWMAMIPIKDKKNPETSLPKDFRHGDIAKMPDKKEVFVAYRINLKTKKRDTLIWEIRRLGKKVEFHKLGVPTMFKARLLDSML